MPGEHLQSSMIGSIVNPPPATAPAFALRPRGCRVLLRRDALVEAVGGHLVHAERLVELAQEVVRRHVAVLELLAVRADLGVDERAHRVTHHQQLFGPLEHRKLLLGRTVIVGGNGARRPGPDVLPNAVRAQPGRRSRARRSHFSRPPNGPKYLVPKRWHGATDRSGGWNESAWGHHRGGAGTADRRRAHRRRPRAAATRRHGRSTRVDARRRAARPTSTPSSSPHRPKPTHPSPRPGPPRRGSGIPTVSRSCTRSWRSRPARPTAASS